MSEPNDYKIAIIGPADVVSGFRALGVEVLNATDTATAIEQLRSVKQRTATPDSNEKYAVVCVIEDLLTGVDQAEYAKIVSGPLPAVVLLPGTAGSQGYALDRLRSLAERAIGSAII